MIQTDIKTISLNEIHRAVFELAGGESRIIARWNWAFILIQKDIDSGRVFICVFGAEKTRERCVIEWPADNWRLAEFLLPFRLVD